MYPTDKVRGTIRIDVEDRERANEILAVYQKADQDAHAILTRPAAGEAKAEADASPTTNQKTT
jgi:hypothetical protein